MCYVQSQDLQGRSKGRRLLGYVGYIGEGPQRWLFSVPQMEKARHQEVSSLPRVTHKTIPFIRGGSISGHSPLAWVPQTG